MTGQPTDFTPQMLALDIDGTLVDHEGVMPDEVLQAVTRLRHQGLPVVLATGRSWGDTVAIFEQLGLPHGPAVTSNGAVVVEYPPLRVRKQVTFDPGPAIRKVVAAAPHLRIAVEHPEGGYRLNTLFPEGDLSGEMRLESIDELCREPVTRVIIRDPDASSEDFQRLAKSLGIRRRHVLALGDGRNDVHMLKWAGRGVAMGDAPGEVKQVADHVTGDFAAGGTVAELSRWFA